MDRSARIRAQLEQAFDAQVVEVYDESEQHRGHAGYQEGGQSHFRVVLRAPEFADMNRIARHRAVHAAIGAQLMGEIHALALELST
ncbi:BolA family protein [Litorivita sp. NS0012-18]|uniref:BolA family protein n=1 Tax=Litorivita sp. NS0012-18 TaxID=3127655 RepID=UPI00310A323B